MPVFNGSEGGWISRSAAKDGIDEYVASSAYVVNQNIKAHYFGRDFLDALLAQSGCVGLRIWYGIGPDSTNTDVPQLYVVGVDANGNDILPATNPLVADMSMPCPRNCPTGTSLDN